MMFVVEDGTGLPNAVAYVPVEWVDDYFLLRGAKKWRDATHEDKEYAIVLATDYIDASYVFPGVRLDTGQSLEWPRSGAYDKYGTPLVEVPGQIKKATAELAIRALEGSLLPDLENQGTVKMERVEGVVTIEYGGDGAYPLKSFTYIDRFLIAFGVALSKTGGIGNRGLLRV